MKKIKLKGILFQNLYEDILVRQKFKRKQRNPFINSIDRSITHSPPLYFIRPYAFIHESIRFGDSITKEII